MHAFWPLFRQINISLSIAVHIFVFLVPPLHVFQPPATPLRWIEQNTKLCHRLVFFSHYCVGSWIEKMFFRHCISAPLSPVELKRILTILDGVAHTLLSPPPCAYCNNTEMLGVSFFTKCVLIFHLVAVFAVEILFGNHQTSNNPVLPGLAWYCAFWPSSHTKYHLFSGYVVVNLKS